MAVRYSCDRCGGTLVNEEQAVALDAIEEVDDLHQPGGTVARCWLLCRTCYADVVTFLEAVGGRWRASTTAPTAR